MTRRAAGFGLRSAAVAVVGAAWLLAGCGAERGTVGALIAQTPERRLVLREVPAELASARAGLEPGDEILLIDGRDVRELDERGVHQALAGDVGAPVKLTVVRGERVLRVTLRRTAVPRAGKRKAG